MRRQVYLRQDLEGILRSLEAALEGAEGYLRSDPEARGYRAGYRAALRAVAEAVGAELEEAWRWEEVWGGGGWRALEG